MSRFRSLHALAIVAITIGAGALIAWQVLSTSDDARPVDSTVIASPTEPQPSSLLAPPRDDQVQSVSRLALPVPSEEVSWERDHFPIEVTVDPSLVASESAWRVSPQRPDSPDYWDDDRGLLARASALSTGEVQVRVGRTDGFGGWVTEVRLTKDATGNLRAAGLLYTHRDAGPPFLIPHSDASGSVRLRSTSWTSGDTIPCVFKIEAPSHRDIPLGLAIHQELLVTTP